MFVGSIRWILLCQGPRKTDGQISCWTRRHKGRHQQRRRRTMWLTILKLWLYDKTLLWPDVFWPHDDSANTVGDSGRFLNKAVSIGETYEQIEARRRAFLDGMSAGTFLLRLVSPAMETGIQSAMTTNKSCPAHFHSTRETIVYSGSLNISFITNSTLCPNKVLQTIELQHVTMLI